MSLYKNAHTSEDYLTRKLPAGTKRERISRQRFGGMESVAGGGAVEACRVEAMENMSPRRAPSLATRKPRGMLVTAVGSGVPHGMAAFGGDLYFARGTVLYRMDSEAVVVLGTVSDTDKRFFVFGERLYIYPDKLYLEAGSMTLKPMELDTGVIAGAVFRGNTVTLPAGQRWTALGFAAGECLRVVNADDVMPAPEGYYRILSVNGQVATVQGNFPATYESNAVFRRVVPDLERVCVSGDRVYGVAGKDLYVSAAGNALDFYSAGSGDGRDPVHLRLDSEGDITACVAWQGYVVLFKADRICKLLGSRSDSFTLQERPAVGISARLANTLCEVSGDLYYLAESGVYRYRGQEPQRISDLGEEGVRGGCGGTDGRAYYLAVERRGKVWRQYCYLPETGEWYGEDGMRPVCMMARDGYLCIQDTEGYLWRTSSDGRDPDCVYDETAIVGAVVASVTLPPDYGFQPDGCRPVGIYLRATGEAGSVLEVMGEYACGGERKDADGSREMLLGVFSGKMTDRLLRVPLAPRICDGLRLRLVMTGGWVIHEVTCEYEKCGG